MPGWYRFSRVLSFWRAGLTGVTGGAASGPRAARHRHTLLLEGPLEPRLGLLERRLRVHALQDVGGQRRQVPAAFEVVQVGGDARNLGADALADRDPLLKGLLGVG